MTDKTPKAGRFDPLTTAAVVFFLLAVALALPLTLPGSPYSLKLRAALRYRRIPHNWIVPPGYLGEGGELKAADKGMIPVLQLPDGRYWADSTPMILALETRHPGVRSLLPDDPTDRFLALLIEDFADETGVELPEGPYETVAGFVMGSPRRWPGWPRWWPWRS